MVNTLSYCPTGFHTVLFTHPPQSFLADFLGSAASVVASAIYNGAEGKGTKKIQQSTASGRALIKSMYNSILLIVGYFSPEKIV
jgi:hypothetical protein